MYVFIKIDALFFFKFKKIIEKYITLLLLKFSGNCFHLQIDRVRFEIICLFSIISECDINSIPDIYFFK